MTHTNSMQWFGSQRPIVTLGAGIMMAVMLIEAGTPIAMYGVPSQPDVPTVRVDGSQDLMGGRHNPWHNDFHLSEVSSSVSSGFAMTRNFPF